MKKILVKLASAAVVLAAFLPVSEASAWTRRGHQIVADIAEANLTPRAKQEVSRLLAMEGKKRLNEVASWADSIRGVTFPKQPSHAVRIPVDANSYSPERDCGDGNCVLAAISHNIEDLSNRDAPDESRLVALKYLTHFIGDLHQPLHASKDTGQRKVIYQGEEKTLHAVWDKDLIACPRTKFQETAKRLMKDEDSPRAGGDPASWAMESHDIARDKIFPDLAGLSGDPAVLPDSYCDANWPIASSRLKFAGVRLASLINQALDR
ncbi:S1/P1 nuclease [Neorhizobium sp. DAR64861/K0K2]|uniref:S1/P1 nuclease n=1 Tax=unclassified Neorhizobium TaxID=2629175 RepID=UPI003D27D64B